MIAGAVAATEEMPETRIVVCLFLFPEFFEDFLSNAVSLHRSAS